LDKNKIQSDFFYSFQCKESWQTQIKLGARMPKANRVNKENKLYKIFGWPIKADSIWANSALQQACNRESKTKEIKYFRLTLFMKSRV